jgi:hypothetical protein
MQKPYFTVDVIGVIENGDYFDPTQMEQECDAISANYKARACFLLKVLVDQRTIICKVLLGIANETCGHRALSDNNRLPRFVSAGGGMLWTTPRTEGNDIELRIGSFSESFYSVPASILRLVGDKIAEKVRDMGVTFDSINICPAKEPHPIWKEDPYKELME